MKRLVGWFRALPVVGKVGVILAVFIGVSIVGAAGQTPPTKQLVKPTSLNVASSSETKPEITTKTVTSTESVPFTSTTVQDGTLAKGTSKVATKGVDGTKTLTYQDTYTDGKRTEHKLVSEVITIQPIKQVTSVGTYVAPTPSPTCTNGTYVNSAGNTVCSPETASSAPSGATAQCVDGTYSFSQHHSGTCSHHGGVSQWLN